MNIESTVSGTAIGKKTSNVDVSKQPNPPVQTSQDSRAYYTTQQAISSQAEGEPSSSSYPKVVEFKLGSKIDVFG
jgi:hypothetical protein